MDKESAGQWAITHWQELIAHPLVASLLGAIGAAFYAFPGATVGVKALNGCFCFVIGIYVGPALVEWRGIESKRIAALIIIASALGGLIVVNSILEYLRNTKFADLPGVRAFLKRSESSE